MHHRNHKKVFSSRLHEIFRIAAHFLTVIAMSNDYLIRHQSFYREVRNDEVRSEKRSGCNEVREPARLMLWRAFRLMYAECVHIFSS